MVRHPPDARSIAAQQKVGERVRAHRKALGLSQEQLAEQCGMHRTFVGLVERGKVSPTLGTLVMISEGLGVDLSILVYGLGSSPG